MLHQDRGAVESVDPHGATTIEGLQVSVLVAVWASGRGLVNWNAVRAWASSIYRLARQAARSPAAAIRAMPAKPSASGSCWNTSQPRRVAKAMCM
jgi:hypothetical protein